MNIWQINLLSHTYAQYIITDNHKTIMYLATVKLKFCTLKQRSIPIKILAFLLVTTPTNSPETAARHDRQMLTKLDHQI